MAAAPENTKHAFSPLQPPLYYFTENPSSVSEDKTCNLLASATNLAAELFRSHKNASTEKSAEQASKAFSSMEKRLWSSELSENSRAVCTHPALRTFAAVYFHVAPPAQTHRRYACWSWRKAQEASSDIHNGASTKTYTEFPWSHS